jgi:hypothetical protein
MGQSVTRRLGTTAWVRKRGRSEGVGQEVFRHPPKQSEEIEERTLSVRLAPGGGQNDDFRPLTYTLGGRGMGRRDEYVTS